MAAASGVHMHALARGRKLGKEVYSRPRIRARPANSSRGYAPARPARAGYRCS